MPGAYVVRDANGQALVYVYSRENEAEALQAKVLTADEARRVAINVAKLPEFHQRRQAAGVIVARQFGGGPMMNDRDVTGPHFAWFPVRAIDGLIWLKSYWTSGFLNFADETDAMEHWPSSCSEWRLSERKQTRIYRFHGVTPPEPSTLLTIEFCVSKSLSGHIHTRLCFYLRPYLYLLPDRAPFPDNYVMPPFRLGFFGGTGAGSEASPTLLGGIFELSFFPADECPPGSGDDMAALEMNRPRDVMACIAVISSGEPITFTLIEGEGGMSIKLRLQLPNDQPRRFQQLYENLQRNAV